jgi:hypothetical protein
MIHGFERFTSVGAAALTASASYGVADPEITDVRFDPATPSTGDTVEMEVDVRNTRQSSGFDVFGVTVTSPALSTHIIQYCALIGGGDTTTVDGSTSLDPGLDGEFTFVTDPMQIEVVAYGFTAGTDCTTGNFPGRGQNVTSETVTLAGQGSTVAEPTFALSNLRLSDTPTVGQTVQISVDITNTGGEGSAPVSVGLSAEPGAFDTSVQRSPTLAGGATQTVTASFDISPGGGDFAYARATSPSDTLEVPITVRTPALDDAIEVVAAGFASSTTPTDGEEVLYEVRVKNVSQLTWRVEATFSDGSGNVLDTDVFDALAPDGSTLLVGSTTATAPELSVCYALSGQVIA